MLGMFLTELYKYVSEKFGDSTWKSLLEETGIGPRVYIASSEYPDQEMVDLVSAFSKKAGMSIPDVLEGLGEFVAEDMVKIYGIFFDPQWRTLDLLQNISGIIHKKIQNANPKAKPPDFTCHRVDHDELTLIYSSPDRLCPLAIGMAKGFAKHYNEQILVTEKSCTIEGTPSCEISVKLLEQHSYA